MSSTGSTGAADSDTAELKLDIRALKALLMVAKEIDGEADAEVLLLGVREVTKALTALADLSAEAVP